MVQIGVGRSAPRCFAVAAVAALVLAGVLAAPARAFAPVTGSQQVFVMGCRYAEPTAPQFLDQAGSGIGHILDQLHQYYDTVSNSRVDVQGQWAGWYDIAQPFDAAFEAANAGQVTVAACQIVAQNLLAARGLTVSDFRAVVMLFDIDGGWGSAAVPVAPAVPGTAPDFSQGAWVHLRFSGGQGGWTSLATWVHELGHTFGLEHTTYLARQVGNQYSDVQTPMSGFSHVSQERWWFEQPYVCNGVATQAACIAPGHQDQVPLDYAAFELDQLGWLGPDQMVDHWGGFATYDLSAPTYNPRNEPTLERRKLVKVRIPGTDAYYAIEYRRGNDGPVSNAEATRRGWNSSYELGLASDRVTVYYVNPGWQGPDLLDDLGDAVLLGVLDPGATFTASPGWPALSVQFLAVPDAAHMHGLVNVSTPLPQGPGTTITLPPAHNAWYNGPVTLTLPHTTVAAPFATTYYGIDDPGCTPDSRACAVYAGPVTVTGEGVHVVAAFSTDILGDAGPVVRIGVPIDLTPPQTTATLTAVSTGGATLSLVASDQLSGVAGTEAAVDGGAFTPYTAAITVTGAGPHVVRYRSIDVAGNVEATQQLVLGAPLPPLQATAVATPPVLTPANGRAVSVHIAVRANDAPGVTAKLASLTRIGGRGRTSGWTIGAADFDGVLYATSGATYRFTYTVADALGRTTHAVVSVTVRA